MRNKFKNNLRRVVSLFVIMAMLTTSMPLDLIPEGWGRTLFNNIKEALAEEESIETYNINSPDNLITLYNMSPSTYQNANILIAPTAVLDMTDTDFKGLGSAEYPFCGSIAVSGNVSVPITINCSLFNYLSQTASVGTESNPLYLQAADNIDTALLAEYYVKGKSSDNENDTDEYNCNVYVKISVENTYDNDNKTYSTFGGIVGTIDDDAKLVISITNDIDIGYSKITGKGNRGFFCNTMNKNSELYIKSYIGDDSYTIISQDSNAGAIVGYMSENSKLTINCDTSYTGTVTAKKNSGGIVGYAEKNSSIFLKGVTTISGNVSSSDEYAGGIAGGAENINIEGNVNITNSEINGKIASGGIIGKYTFSNSSETNFDLSNYISSTTFTGGTYAGGVFGELYNQSTDSTFVISNSAYSEDSDNEEDLKISSIANGATNFGGLIGFYEATNLASTLDIKNIKIYSDYNAAKTSYGGVIGVVSSITNSYVSIENLEVNVNGTASSSYFGGLIALSEGGSMFNVGTVKVSGTGSTDGVYGGIIGRLKSGVLRLYGTTDISGISAKEPGVNYGQIVGTRDSALIYAMGNGSNAVKTSGNASNTEALAEDGSTDVTSETGWSLIRDGSKLSVSDVGSWGEVVRIDGTKLSELKQEGFTDIEAQDTNHLLLFDTKNHTVTIAGFYDYSTSSDTKRGYIYSTQNFAAMALSNQCNGATGALKLSVSDSLMTWWIYMEEDVDLTGTGIICFQRDVNDDSLAFKGLFDGQNHKITLATGETYGLLSDGSAVGDTEGCGQIYNHKTLGLFAATGEMDNNGKNGIKNLTVDGTITFGNVGGNNQVGAVWCGAISAKQTGSNALYDNVTTSVTITDNDGSNTNSMPDVYIGGMIGYVSTGCNITFNSCTWDGEIINNCGAYQYYHGGFIACMSDNSEGSITVKDCNIKGTINANKTSTDAKMGGLLAITQNNGNKKITITINNLEVDKLSMTNSATSTSGGFLGYEWHNVVLDVDGLTISNSELSTSAGFGGLVYEASGYWKVHDDGIKYSTGNTLSGKTLDESPSALLVCRGDDYRNKNYALYMEIGAGAYTVDNTTTVTLTGGTYFDELVGISINSNNEGNGIVSIATDDATLIDQEQCNTYTHQLADSYNNPHTRYYYNLDSYRRDDNEKVWADSTVESGTELLLWSVGQYCESNLSGYFVKNNTRNNNVTIKGAIDLTGLSYYPIDYVGADVTIEDATITFDYEKINNNESDNKPLSDTKKQHYMMQDGLFLTLTSSTSKAATISIKGDLGLTLKGSIGQLDAAQYEGGSGALVCGKANGTIDGTVARTFAFKVASGSKLVLSGIMVSGVDTYAPLLFNEVGSYSSLNVVNVSASDYDTEQIKTTKAATSLIGNVGSENDTNIVVLFENVGLDGRSENSIFRNATFMESFSYAITDLASSGTYNFDSDSEHITYGKEISNGIGGNGLTGRNPYNEANGEGQIWYHDTFGETSEGAYVTDKNTGVISNQDSGFFTDTYLPYVHTPEGGTDGSTSWKHELDINQMVVDILSGCGTYDDPYIIDTEGQLETLGTFLSKGSIAGWKINICYDVAANNENSFATDKTATGATDDTASTDDDTKDDTTENMNHYTYTSGSTWTTTDADDVALTTAQALEYLRNAYYMVTEDITLNGNFYGLGGSDPETNVFSGVIVGKKGNYDKDSDVERYPTITISAHTSTTHSYFGGLIAYSNGSVVKNLILDYSDKVSITLAAKAPSQERADQSFFGGVIGYVVGGDNIIDNVQVKDIDEVSLTINGTDGNKDGTYAELTPVGAYVGLIGGNTESGGGVIFRNMNNSVGFTGTDYVADLSGDDTTDEAINYYYRNPYVGRVLDGYAFSEGCKLENTDKNYTIPQLTVPTDSTSEKEMSVTVDDTKKTGTITISSPQQLWVLSAIVNSGAGGMNSNKEYNSDAYALGCVRTGTYDYVGETAPEQTDPNYSQYQNDLKDCNYRGGVSDTTGNKLSYLVSQYAATGAAYTTGGKYKYGITFTENCDMSSYGNGFRGIGSTYQDNYDASTTLNGTKIVTRTIFLGGTVGGSAEKNIKITIKRNVKEYAVELGTTYASSSSTITTSQPGWWAQGIGLFPAINFDANTTIQYLTISGTAQIKYDNEDYIGEASAGGLAGLTANKGYKTNYTITFKSVNTESLTVSGSKYSGGLVGVFGQSSRTYYKSSNKNGGGYLFTSKLGSIVGPVIFEQCNYNDIHISGGYSAGGYFGTYKNDSQKTTLTGPCTYQDSDISWNDDACLEMYKVVGSQQKNDAKKNGYSGAAGLIGYYYAGAFNINTSSASEKKLSFENITISAPQFAYNCNYGLGGLTGLQSSGVLTAYYVDAENVTVQINIKEDYKGVHEKCDTYYLAPASGVFVGYATANVTLTECNVKNSRVVNAGYAGGFVGCIGSTLQISDSTMNDSVIYTKGAASWDGAPKAGGLSGNTTAALNVKNVSMDHVTVIGDGRVGLITGYTRSSGDKLITSFKATNCIVATTQNEVAKYYLGDNGTDPGASTTTDRETDYAAGTAGLIIGGVTGSASGKYTNLPTLKAFNMQFSDCIVGYYVDGSTLTYSKNDKDEWEFNQAVDETKIGVYTGTDSGIPYSMLTGDAAMSETNKYTEGGLGKLIGGASKINTMNIVGLSIQGEYYPYYENGYGDSNEGIKTSDTSYIIYADYNGTSTGDGVNTKGTINSTYTTSTDASSPYVVVNPSSNLTVYNASTGTDKSALLTGDGTVQNSIDAILSDLSSVTGSKASKPYHMTYYRISSIAKKFMADATSTTGTSTDSTSTNGIYNDKLGTYYDASESDSNNYNGKLDDFPVLVIDTTSSADITALVNSYISLLTNCDQTSLESGKSIYNTIAVKTYQWDFTNNRFVVASADSLKYNSTDKTLSINSNLNDNQNNQFTLLDVVYCPGKIYGTTPYYHLYIPVVVKKVIQVDFSVKMLTGSSTYESIYPTNNAVLASYGENYTALLTYSYTWTAAEWNSYISSGNSLLWNYDKQVQLDIGLNSAGALQNETTRFTLVDTNSYGIGNTYYVDTGNDILSKDDDSDAVIEFKNFEGFNCVPLSDLLTLQAEQDETGALKVTGTGKTGETIPTGSIIRIWNWGDNTDTFTYFGPKSDDDTDEVLYYTVKLTDENGDDYNDTENITVNEVYYLIANCQNGSDVYTRKLSLGRSRLTSDSSNVLPSRIKSSGEKVYTIGDFFTVDNTTIKSESKDSTPVIKVSQNDYIDVTVSSNVNVAVDQADTFDSYSTQVNGYFRFTIKMANNGNLCKIDPDSYAIDMVKIGDTLLSATEFKHELTNGILYIVIDSQTAGKFKNQTVSAKVRFSYENGGEKMYEQFSEESGDSNNGVNFLVESAIAYSDTDLDGTSMSDANKDGTLYYREAVEIIDLTYNAYNSSLLESTINRLDGYTSQLGINDREADGGQTISTLASYDATALTGLDLTGEDMGNYPTKLVCELTLEKKAEQTDQTDGKSQYEAVDINDYIDSFNIQLKDMASSSGDGTSSDSNGTSGIDINASSNAYSFTINLSTEQIEQLDQKPIEIDISYYVHSADDYLTKLSTDGVYANYKVTLKAYLANASDKALVDEASDYIIYTNAKFYLGILGTNDFGN